MARARFRASLIAWNSLSLLLEEIYVYRGGAGSAGFAIGTALGWDSGTEALGTIGAGFG